MLLRGGERAEGQGSAWWDGGVEGWEGMFGGFFFLVFFVALVFVLRGLRGELGVVCSFVFLGELLFGDFEIWILGVLYEN